MIGSVLGNYKILDKIGEGGMGAVYKGVDLMLEREVAIKALRPELASQPQVVERFRAEAVTLAKLNHPNIATLHSFFRQGDDYFMVMEFVRGETLDDLLRRFGGMSCDRALPLFCQALEGIDHAHKMGIVHRDIKPANMMLTELGSIKVMDFGIARVLGSARMTRQGNIIGTIEYMSPEQVRGHETDSRSDIYSLGILLYEMLTGRVPFASHSEYELMRSQIEDAPTPPRDFSPNIPLPIEEAIMRALAKKPEARFQTAGEFRRVLLSQVGPVSVPFEARPRVVPIGGGTIETHITAPGEMTRPTASGEPHGMPALGTADHVEEAVFASGGSGPKETRLPGTPDSIPLEAQTLSKGSGIKETRLPDASYSGPGQGAGVVAALPYGATHDPAFAANPLQPGAENSVQMPAGDGRSGLSRLTFKHYLGAAAIIGVLMVVGAVALIANVVLKPRQQNPASVNQKGLTTTSAPNSQAVSQPVASPEPQGSSTPEAGLVAPQVTDPDSPDKSKRASKSPSSLATQQPGDATASASPIVAPSATPGASSSATAHTPVSKPPASSGKSASNGDTANTGKDEKKKGLFGKIKDKVVQPFKHDSDQKKQ
jgi:serine/threonine protein kinase